MEIRKNGNLEKSKFRKMEMVKNEINKIKTKENGNQGKEKSGKYHEQGIQGKCLLGKREIGKKNYL